MSFFRIIPHRPDREATHVDLGLHRFSAVPFLRADHAHATRKLLLRHADQVPCESRDLNFPGWMEWGNPLQRFLHQPGRISFPGLLHLSDDKTMIQHDRGAEEGRW